MLLIALKLGIFPDQKIIKYPIDKVSAKVDNDKLLLVLSEVL